MRRGGLMACCIFHPIGCFIARKGQLLEILVKSSAVRSRLSARASTHFDRVFLCGW
jgi:hypothetical protein